MTAQARVTVAIPVKNGEHYLGELLEAVFGQEFNGAFEVLVVDSGSKDGSLEIVGRHDVELIELPADQFGHGRTRNMLCDRSRGDYIAFLTQDATPAGPNWLSSMIDSFELADRVGAVFGPHIPRPESSPMIANELQRFFKQMSPNGEPVVHSSAPDGQVPSTFLSNVNSCISKLCWQELRFRDVAYAEDQAFGEDLIAAGWQKVFNPNAAVFHSHSYPLGQFARRYFDEYRGLRDVSGHVEPLRPVETSKWVLAAVSSDRDYMARHSFSRLAKLKWSWLSFLHHFSRRSFSLLGSHSNRLPAWLVKKLSLEGRTDK